ncbi:glyoxalase [Longispora fulva]|uniref:Putative glyoxalase superfamily protein PhnB n=1 Tax=Longispora fulva TaxID=619741 RepID=A0A8J7GFZ3_9ACTN|nr:VOC family protein [Longispora fulva]MBG6135293.1 putative glyoxalase superfamily protein PhnB [Longispora fulva]GIG56468.1 glyoxalase [Longispora fulva]
MTDTTTHVWPGLRYVDAPAALDFLVRAFGFVETARYPGGEPNSVGHAELRWPAGGGIMLGSPRTDSVLRDLPAGTGSVYIVSDDVDALFARAVAAGATVVRGLADEEYGSRGFTVRDPEGVYWSFGTYRGE